MHACIALYFKKIFAYQFWNHGSFGTTLGSTPHTLKTKNKESGKEDSPKGITMLKIPYTITSILKQHWTFARTHGPLCLCVRLHPTLTRALKNALQRKKGIMKKTKKTDGRQLKADWLL
jgi:hypothetical protein